LFHLLVPVVPGLVLWLIKRDQSKFVDDHGREAMNFQISLLIYGAVATIIGIFTCTWWLLLPLVYALGLVGLLLASLATWRCEVFRYPMCIRLLGPGV
jgi:uncharacterized protein